MFGLRLNPPGPYWLEDLLHVAIDQVRRLPDRARRAAAAVRAAPDSARALRDMGFKQARATIPWLPKPAAPPRPPETERLDEPLTWALATQPLAESRSGASDTFALHATASEQLDSIAYILARLRDELRPMMKYSTFPGDEPIALRAAAEFETSLDALLALSRANAATRPQERIVTAA